MECVTHLMIAAALSLLTGPAEAVEFTKPYTLRIPFMSPISGVVCPLGTLCTKGVEMVANTANSQWKFLPNYNVVFDVYDDKCVDYVGLQGLMAYQTKSLQHPVSPIKEVHGNFMIPPPVNITVKNPASILMPLFVNSPCSGVCKVTSRFMPQFDVLTISAGCNEPSINKELPQFRNVYPFLQTLAQYASARVNFVKSMHWQKVAIVSDSVQYSLMDTFGMMKQLQSAKVEILAEEFYLDDPTEAVQRLKQSNARIIFANCYISTCPMLACSIYREQLYGPKYVWILKPDVSFTSASMKRPQWCTTNMLSPVAEGSIYVGADVMGDTFSNATNEFGIRSERFREELKKVDPNIEKHPAYSWRLACIETSQVTVIILDNVEKRLNLRNASLRDYYIGSGAARLPSLTELVREETLKLNVRSLLGRNTLEDTPYGTEPVYPIMMVIQIQNGVRKLVMSFERFHIEGVDRQDKPPDGKYTKGTTLVYRPFVWGTRNGQPPRSNPLMVEIDSHVSVGLSGFIWAMACLLIIACLAIGFARITRRIVNGLANSVLVGTIIFASAVFFFPLTHDLTAMNTFCTAAPALILIGFTIMTTPIVTKVLAVYYGVPRKIAIIRIGLGIWLLFNGILLILWYCYQLPYAWVNSLSLSGEDEDGIIQLDHWLECSLGNDFIYVAIILAAQALFLLFGIVISLLARHQVITASDLPGAIDVSSARVCLFAVVPSSVAVLSIIVQSLRLDVKFGLVALFCEATCAIVLLAIFAQKKPNHPTTPLMAGQSAGLKNSANTRRSNSKRSTSIVSSKN